MCIKNREDLTLVYSMKDCLQFCSLKMPFCAKQIIFADIFKQEFAIMNK